MSCKFPAQGASGDSGTEPFPVLFIGAKCLGPRLQVIGIVDPSIDRVQLVLSQKHNSKAASCYSNTKHFLSVQEARDALQLAGQQPRLIFLCSPPHFRGTIAPGRDLETQIISTFGRKPAIFCEKPVSTARPHEPLGAAERLQTSGNVVSVGYMLRYLKAVQKAKHIIQENNLTVMSIGARYTCAYEKIRKLDWWDKSKLCGPIVEQATHFCDLCRYLGGEVDLDTVQAISLEHDEKAGKLSRQAIDESSIPEEQRIPRATTSFWSENRALGTLTHLIALHGTRYSNEIVITADGYQLRLVDLYTNPTLYLRTPTLEQEEVYTYPDDDPFYTELSNLIDVVDGDIDGTVLPEDKVLSSYSDACKTYEFTWRIRDESEK
ncbi:hypothetical protein FQN54_001591 [Arachnomyces sp. PD_36]|nr:hypothetical protein FQN54_001591 [Arachnomyces sp. PD_36]